MLRVRRAVIFVAIFLCTAGFDQGSKHWANTSLTPGVAEPVIDGLWDWQLAKNTGVAFSRLSDIPGGQILLSILAAIALIAIGVMAMRTRPDERMKLAGLALVGGGALGNLVDRVRDGAVTDFVRWRAGEHLWPIFNVADVALVIGAGLLLLETALARRRRAMIDA